MRTVPLAGDNQGDILLVRFDFDTPLYTTTCERDIVYDSNTYSADGMLLEYKHPTERADAKVQRASLRLAPLSGLMTALSGDYLFRRVFVYGASLDTEYQVEDDPYLMGVFLMSRYILRRSEGEKTVELELFSEAQPFRRRNGVIASGLDQRARSTSTDAFFDFTDNLDGELNWGGKRLASGSLGGGDNAWRGGGSSNFFNEVYQRNRLEEMQRHSMGGR